MLNVRVYIHLPMQEDVQTRDIIKFIYLNIQKLKLKVTNQKRFICDSE